MKNPKIFQKNPKSSVSKHVMHEYERLEAYQMKKMLKKLEETLRKKNGVSEKDLGVEKTDVSRERSREMSCGSHEEIK